MKVAGIKDGTVVVYAVVEQENVDRWARAIGIDYLVEVDPAIGVAPDAIRTLEVGDKITLKAGAKIETAAFASMASIDKVQKAAKVEAAAVEGG